MQCTVSVNDAGVGIAQPVSTATLGVLPDEEVVGRVLAGDRPQFEVLMRRYNQRLFRICRSILRCDAEAEDAVQEAYLAAYRHLDQFAGRARFSTWLTRIAVNEASARARRRRPRRWSDLSLQDESMLSDLCTDEAAPEDRHDGREIRAVISRALGRLPEKLRITFALRELESLSTAETAECLGVPKAVVRARLHRARLALALMIDAELGAEIRRLFQFDGDRCDRIVRGVLNSIARSEAETALIRCSQARHPFELN